MKLYATVTSERATKGQGGNKDLLAVFKGETENSQRIDMLTVMLRYDSISGLITLRARSQLSEVDDIVINLKSSKGKKQKDEKAKNPCGHELCSPDICGDNLPF